MQLAKAIDTVEGITALQKFDAILIGGASMHPQLRSAAKRLGITVVTTYGSSETAGGCVYDGVALDGVKVRVVEGRVWLGGPTIAHGYRNYPDHPAFAVPGWYETSDGGELVDGSLHIAGRLDNLIVSGGLKLHPEVLETAMHHIDGVDTAVVTSTPHPRVGEAIVAAYIGRADISGVINGLVDQDTPRWQMPKDIKHLNAMPLTANGKIDRQAVKALWQTQKL